MVYTTLSTPYVSTFIKIADESAINVYWNLHDEVPLTLPRKMRESKKQIKKKYITKKSHLGNIKHTSTFVYEGFLIFPFVLLVFSFSGVNSKGHQRYEHG